MSESSVRIVPEGPASAPEVPHLRSDPHALQRSFLAHVQYTRGQGPDRATPWDKFLAIAMLARDRLAERWVATKRTYRALDPKRAYYLSAEYLLGRALGNNLIATGLLESAREGLRSAGVDLDALIELEPDAGLGNGGLGRLAACFLDSMATLGYPGMGYGIRYEFGIFRQDVIGGHQVERADEWLKFGNPWEIVRPEKAVPVRFYGSVERGSGRNGAPVARWVGGKTVLGVPYDTPVAGFGVSTVNTLRLWQARASEEFDFRLFNAGDYERSVVEKNDSEVISKVLYPNDQNQAGKELRLRQEYFFVACSLADIVRRYLRRHEDFRAFPQKVAIQLNDTHPAVAIAELLRLMVDEKQVPWDEAWEVTVATFGYTNHTLLAEALEMWPVSFFERLLPRHLEIIYEINQRFLRQVQIRHPFDAERLRRMSLIEEGPEKKVRMAHLAVVGSHSVNGVAELHTELLKRDVLPDFADFFPERFNNKTNGVTPRRWLLQCNPRLSSLITSRIGDGWVRDLEQLRGLEALVKDAGFLSEFRAAKQANKQRLVDHVRDTLWLNLEPTALFDVQVKRLHEYKRQLLNALHIVALWMRSRENPASVVHPRVFLFGAKAAPGYLLGQADHPADQRHRRGGERRLGTHRHPGGVPPQLPGEPGRADHPRGGPVGADLHRRQGGLRHGEHEVRPQRGAHPRHARRGEHRDPRRGGPGELLPLRPDRRPGGPDAARRLPAGRGPRPRPRAARGAGAGRFGLLLARGPGAVPARWWTRSCGKIATWSSPTSGRTPTPRPRWCAPTPVTPRAGPAVRCSTWRGWAGSARTGASTSTRATSGASPPSR